MGHAYGSEDEFPTFPFRMLDRQNKKLAELEETVRKLESLKTIAESQNMDLVRKLKEAEKGGRGGTLRRKPPDEKECKDSYVTDRKRPINKGTGKDKGEAADKSIDIISSKKELESFLRLANKERNVLERKIALLEKTRQQTSDVKIDDEISSLRQQHKGLLHNIADRDKKLIELDDELDEDSEQRSRDVAGPSTIQDTPKSTLRRKTTRRLNRSSSPHNRSREGGSERTKKVLPVAKKNDSSKKADADKKVGKKKISRNENEGTGSLKRSTKKTVQEINVDKKKDDDCNSRPVKIDRSNYTGREQQTMIVSHIDKEVQVELFEEEDVGEMYDPFSSGFNMGGGKFMFQEEEVATSELGRTHSNDNVVDEYEEKLAALQTLRENDMEKISSLGEIIDQYKQDIGELNHKAGSYCSELEANNSKLNSSMAEIEKLNFEIKSLQKFNYSIDELDSDDLGIEVEKELTESKKEVTQLNSDVREKQITIMKLHQELHEASEQVMDKSGMVRQLEALVDNLKQDKDILREEQITFESTTEEVLDQLRTQKVRSNQLEELVKSLEMDGESHKHDLTKVTDENLKIQTDKEKLQLENEELASKLEAREMELESALSEHPELESSQVTLNLLQEVRQKENAMKNMQHKHEETLEALKKEVEKQVTQLQSKVSRRDDDLANIKSQYNSETSDLTSQINDMQTENANLRETIFEHEREKEDSYCATANDNSSIEFKELNKRLGELANENMMLRDEINNSKNISNMNAKRSAGFMGEIQQPEVTSTKQSIDAITDFGIELDEEEEEEDIGEISVALVLYSYDPATMSPNDYPEDELALSSGDFIYIFGDPDEDGFYTAELMSGERGLVPSNFIQTVELNEKKTLQMRRISKTQRLSVSLPKVGATTSSKSNRNIPAPESIECEEIGSKSLQLSWTLPETLVPIIGFKVFINSQEFRVTSTGECRTVLNDVPSSRPLYLTLRTLSTVGEGRESQPCIHGRDPIKAPQSLDVTNIMSNSAVIAFVGQPHYHHAVLLNTRHAASLNPGEFVYMLRGLDAATEYDIKIITLSSDSPAALKQTSYSHSTTFATKTLVDSKHHDWKPLSPPLSLEPAPSAPDNLELNILDRQTIKLSWSSADGAASYQTYLNNELERTTLSSCTQTFSLGALRDTDDEQCFHVIALNSNGEQSLPSETISFSKSALLPQLSSYFDTAGLISPPPSETSESEQDSSLPHQIQSKLLVRVVTPPPGSDFRIGQLLCVEEIAQGYRTTTSGHVTSPGSPMTGHVVPAACVSEVPISQRVVALYDYHPATMSPNTDSQEELNFRAGDVILVFGQEAGGFLKGVLDSREGLVPPNFVLDLEAVLNLRGTLEEDTPTSRESLIEIPSNLMAVNSS